MPVNLTAIDTTVIPNDGGYLLTLTGQFELGTGHKIYIGATGTINDPLAYAGQGNGNTAFPDDATTMRVYTPLLSVGNGHNVLVVQVDSLDQSVLLNALDAVIPDFPNLIFEIRRLLPMSYRTGPRNMDRTG